MSQRVPLPEAITGQKIIPVARGLDATSAPDLVEALQDGGLAIIEVTIETEAGFDALAAVAQMEVTVGAGSVTSVGQAERALELGAEFLVSPHLDDDLVAWSTRNGKPLIPGGFTPTEIHSAWSAGVPAVKIFPASLGGPGYVSSLLAPLPGMDLIPTGGVDASNAGAYLAAGSLAVGVGSWLTGSPDRDVIAERASQLVGQVA